MRTIRGEQHTFRRSPLLARMAPLLLLCGLALLRPVAADAHAHLVRADLTPDGRVLVTGGTYRFWFDESLNAALSRIVIRDARGQQVGASVGAADATDANELAVRLPALPAGQYSVYWTSDSATDGHTLRGFYLFTAGGAGARAPATVPTAFATPDAPSLDATALALAIAHWLILAATAVWTGAVALEVLVLRPGRAAQLAEERDLATVASRSIGPVLHWSLLAALFAQVAEIAVQAYAAGGWDGIVSSSVLRDILQSRYGIYWLIRAGILLLLLTLVSAAIPDRGGRNALMARSQGTDNGPIAAPLLVLLVASGLAALVSLALSGHAATVPTLLLTSVVLDTLHLVSMSIWIGGIAAIALLLVPAFGRDGERRRDQNWRLALLGLLDRFSAPAFLAILAAAATGMFNAQVRMATLDAFTATAYGRFLLVKLALIAELLLLSASHVLLTRPRLRAHLQAEPSTLAATAPGPSARVEPQRARADERSQLLAEGFASLILRLRVEPIVGGLVLLCVALMGQVAPSTTALTSQVGSAIAGSSARDTPIPQISNLGPIAVTGTRGALAVDLRLDNGQVGRTAVHVALRERGVQVPDAQVRVEFSMPLNSQLGASFVETSPVNGEFVGSADLVQAGIWRATVLVRTHSDPLEYRPVGFDFVVGALPAFARVLAPEPRFGPGDVHLDQPSNGQDTLRVRLKAGLRVRLAVTMVSMAGMGTGFYAAVPSNADYAGTLIFPMAGLTEVEVQVRGRDGWSTVRLLSFLVDDAGHAIALPPDPNAAITER